jgi:transcriptional regulator with XRE-family HTH domain
MSSNTRNAKGGATRRIAEAVMFGMYLRKLREARSRSTIQVASVLGCSRQFVSDLERGLRTTSDLRTWLRLAKALSCDPVELVERAWIANGWISLRWSERAASDVKGLLRRMDEDRDAKYHR